MNPADRVALILRRAIIRAEALQAEVEQLQARLAEFEQTAEEQETHSRDS